MIELAIFVFLVLLPVYLLYSCCSKPSPANNNNKPKAFVDVKPQIKLETSQLLSRLHVRKADSIITISLKAELLSTSVYENLGNVLDLLIGAAKVFLVVGVASEEEQKSIHKTIEKLAPAYIAKYPLRILFYSTGVGKIAFIRQLKPTLHVEYDPQTYESIQPHVPINIIHQLADNEGTKDHYAKRPYPNKIERIVDLQTLTVKE